MENLTIKGFINEMSYKMNLEELENTFFKYQDTIIDFIVKNVYDFKERNLFNEVCEIIRSDKFMSLIGSIVYSDDDRIKPDMAYVLHVVTNSKLVDDSVKALALELGYHLREAELGKVVDHAATNVCIIIAATKAPRDYVITSHMRTKCTENIIKSLPEMLYNAYHKDYEAKQIGRNVIYTIISKAVLDVTPAEIVTAFCKVEFPKDAAESIKEYALRLRAFLYEITGYLGDVALTKILTKACEAIRKFNHRFGANESFANKYLNFRLLEQVCERMKNEHFKTKSAECIMKTYKAVKRFKDKNDKYVDLF